MKKVTTLNQFIIEQQQKISGAIGDFSRILHHIGIAILNSSFFFF